ncbi:hypothetical protein H8356DRAFT_1343820 [Neocallimastix lanati (nom. inval.)]|nr:hypothetical protein H8356DRAFT_1343820 [Neocallimastix sp. JGI-2020a]
MILAKSFLVWAKLREYQYNISIICRVVVVFLQSKPFVKTTITQQIMEILYCDFPLKLYSLESYGRELQHMLKSTLLDY